MSHFRIEYPSWTFRHLLVGLVLTSVPIQVNALRATSNNKLSH